MTIDKATLKALAEAATQGERAAEMCARGIPHVTTEEWDIAEVHVTSGDNPMADAEFMAAASPATVLALLAEIERLTGFVVHRRSQADEYDEVICKIAAQRDQLKSENEALRKDAERYRFVRNPIGTSSPLAIWNEGKMPLFSGMADSVVDEFMAKEASHG